MKDNSGHSEGGEVPKLTKEQAIEPMDSARKYAKLLKIDYGLRANQIAQIEADVREAYYQGYELGHKSTGSVAAPKPDTLKDYHAYLNYEDVQKENERLSAEIERLKKSNKALYRIAQQKLYETEVNNPEFANIRSVLDYAQELLK